MKDTGGPAFPVLKHHDNGHIAQVAYGMTLRDWYAGMAMQGWLASGNCTHDYIRNHLAFDSYALADAMLAERSKT